MMGGGRGKEEGRAREIACCDGGRNGREGKREGGLGRIGGE